MGYYREAYAQGKKERPPFVPHDQSSSEDDSDPIPDELLCPICNDLMTDAVVIPCCGNSYCDDCEFSPLMCICAFCTRLCRAQSYLKGLYCLYFGLCLSVYFATTFNSYFLGQIHCGNGRNVHSSNSSLSRVLQP